MQNVKIINQVTFLLVATLLLYLRTLEAEKLQPHFFRVPSYSDHFDALSMSTVELRPQFHLQTSLRSCNLLKLYCIHVFLPPSCNPLKLFTLLNTVLATINSENYKVQLHSTHQHFIFIFYKQTYQHFSKHIIEQSDIKLKQLHSRISICYNLASGNMLNTYQVWCQLIPPEFQEHNAEVRESTDQKWDFSNLKYI